jgi:ribulose-phosphate 3-epimerase
VAEARDWLRLIDTVLVMGTPMGVKGLGLDPRAGERVRAVRPMVEGRGIRVFADGGIREETAPLLKAAGADGIVPGSLVTRAPDLGARVEWLKSL